VPKRRETVRCEQVETSAGPEAAFVFHAVRGRMRLALTPARVIATSSVGTVELPWKAIGAVEIYTLPGGRAGAEALGIAATQPGAAVWTRGGWLGRLNRHTTAYEVSFKPHAFAADAEAVVNAISAYRRDARRRRAIGSEQEHARLLRELGETTPARA
jgi:hypothetical protein